MTTEEVVAFVAALDEVQREDNFGYTFFFVGDDHRLPFVTIGHSDNEFDTVSNLDREGVYRLNIGVSKQTVAALLSDKHPDEVDYSVLDHFLPHPHYANQHWVAILNPTGANADRARQLILEAHSIAAARAERRNRA